MLFFIIVFISSSFIPLEQAGAKVIAVATMCNYPLGGKERIEAQGIKVLSIVNFEKVHEL
jgi:orotate phosphoribosyltransferase